MRSHAIDLHAANTNREMRISFNEMPAPGRQRRLQGRVMLVPDVDLTKFKTRAVIDWLDIRFKTLRNTQPKWVLKAVDKAIGKRCFTQPLDGKAGHEFRMRFQEPDMAVVQKAIDAIRADMGIDGEVEVHEMEVSLDFIPVVPDDAQRMLLVGVLTRHFLPGRDIISSKKDWPRFTWGEGDTCTGGMFLKIKNRPGRLSLLFTDHDRKPFSDATVYFGAKGAVSSWRVMDKVIDRQNKSKRSWIDLPPDRRRVRIEVTLLASELRKRDIVTFEDLKRFKFTTLQKSCFRFMLPTFADTSTMDAGRRKAVKDTREAERRKRFMAAGVVGLKAMDDAWADSRAVQRKDMRAVFRRNEKTLKTERVAYGPMQTLVAYEKLNDRVAMALRKLTERVKKQSV